MATVHVTEQNFADTVKSGIVLLDFWASWCGPCRAFGPIFEAASDKHPDLVFGKIDTEAEKALAGAFKIRAIPTLMVMRDGVVLFNEAGMLPAKALEDLIRQVRELDMDKVRQEIKDKDAASGAAGA